MNSVQERLFKEGVKLCRGDFYDPSLSKEELKEIYEEELLAVPDVCYKHGIKQGIQFYGDKCDWCEHEKRQAKKENGLHQGD